MDPLRDPGCVSVDPTHAEARGQGCTILNEYQMQQKLSWTSSHRPGILHSP